MLKKKTRKLIRERKSVYDNDKKTKILESGCNKFHECVKAFTSNEKQKAWSPTLLYPGASNKQAAENLDEFFNNISSEYDPLDMNNIPLTTSVPIPKISPKQVREEIKKGKLTKSRVTGDIFVNVLADSIDVLSHPISRIYNSIVTH